MPFKSKAQMRAAFGGYLGKKMKAKAKTWADETPDIKGLPEHKKKKSNKSKFHAGAYHAVRKSVFKLKK